MNIGLTVDEAHYALYGYFPALSYFDHPPLIGWLQIPFVYLGGENWMMRLAPLLLLVVALALIVLFARSLTFNCEPSIYSEHKPYTFQPQSKQVAYLAVALFLLSPALFFYSLALLPDIPLISLTIATLWLALKISVTPQALRLWILLGFVLGLAGLSKYTAFFLALGCFIYFFVVMRSTLWRHQGFWYTIALALICIIPVLTWNIQNDWISLRYQLNHVSADRPWQAYRVLAFLLLQLLMFGPLIVIGWIIFIRKLRKHYPQLFLASLCIALPLLGFVSFQSGQASVLPHWTLTAWVALIPASAIGIHYRLSSIRANIKNSGTYTGNKVFLILSSSAILWQLTLIILMFYLLATGGNILQKPFFPQGGNPFLDPYDWQEASTQAQKLLNAHQAEALLVSNWTLASRLAWYARPNKVWTLDSKNKQFEIWYGKQHPGALVLWVNWSEKPYPLPRETCTPLAHSFQGRFTRFDYYLCRL